MAAIRLMRKWSVPLATAVSVPLFSPSVFADSGSKDSAKATSRMVRPSELPIYEEPEEVLNFEYHGRERTSLEEGVGVVRKEVEGVIEATRSTREKIVHICETGKAHTMATVDYITDEDNIIPRAGAITIGGLAGLVLGARKKGGLVKKVLYTSTGVAATASLCYPRQAYQISQQVYGQVKDYANIGYNFVAGVKPQSKVATPDEPKKEPPVEPSKEAEVPPSTEGTTAPEEPPVTSEPEGDEVRSVLPQALPDEKLPAPLDNLAQQSSDVMQWGFRLTDKTTNASSVRPDVVPPAEPAVPEGFGSVCKDDNKDDLKTATDHVIVEELVKGAAESETVTIPKAVESLVTDVAEKVAEDIVEKAGEELLAKGAEVVSEMAQETEEEAKEVAEVAKVVEEVSDKGESVVEVVKDVVEAADKAAHDTPGMSETALDVVKEIAEEVEKVVETVNVIAEKVEEVAEGIAKEAEDVKTKALELVENEEKREELIEKVIDYVKEELETESVEKLADTVTTFAEKVEEVAEDMKTKAIEFVESEEKREEIIEKVIDFVKDEYVAEPVQEVKEAVEAYDREMVDISTEEGTVATEPAPETKEQEPKVEEMGPDVTAAVEEREPLPVTETVDTYIEEPSPVTEIAEVKETLPSAERIEPNEESDHQVPVRKEGLFDRLISLFTKDDEENVGKASAISGEPQFETEGVKEASADLEPEVKSSVEEAVLHVIEKVTEDIIEKVGEVAVEKTAEIVDEISKEVEQEAALVAETAEAVKEVGDEVASALKVAAEVAEAAAEAAKAVPNLPEILKEKTEMAVEIVEEAEKLDDTITLVAEKVKEEAEEVEEKSAAIEFKAAELISSEKKREEFIENVVDFVTEKLTGESSLTEEKMDIPKPETELAEENRDACVGETPEVAQDVVKEEEPEQLPAVETQDHIAEREVTVEVTKSSEEEVKEPKIEEIMPEERVGLVDKLINFITKNEEKIPIPIPVEEETKLVEAVTPEEASVSREHAEEKEPGEQVAEEFKAVSVEVPMFEGLKDNFIPVEEVDEQIAKELEDQVSKSEVEEVKPKELEGHVEKEVQEVTDQPLKPVVEELKEKTLEEKEGLVDKLLSLFSTSEEKEVTPVVTEEERTVPSVELEEALLTTATDTVQEPAEVKSDLPLVDATKELPVENEVSLEAPSPKYVSSEEIKEPSVVDVQDPKPEIIEPLKKEGLFDKLVNLISQKDEDVVEVKPESVDDIKAVTPLDSADVVPEGPEGKPEELPLIDAAKEVPYKSEAPAEVPVSEDLKEHVIEAPVEQETVTETPVEQEPTDSFIKEIVAEAQEAPIKEEKVGLLDKLVSIFTNEDKVAVPVKDDTIAKFDATELKGENYESVVSEDLVIIEEAEKEVPVEIKEVVGNEDVSRGPEGKSQELSLTEESKEVPHASEAAAEVPVSEDLKKHIIEIPVEHEPTAAVVKEEITEAQEAPVIEEKVGLFDKLISMFTNEDKVAVPVKDDTIAKLDIELKGESDESIASKDAVIIDKVEKEVPVEITEVVGDESLEIEDLVIIEKVEKVPEDEKVPVPEPVTEMTTSVGKESVENKGLIGKLADLFSKDENKDVEPPQQEIDSKLSSPLSTEGTLEKDIAAESPENVIDEIMTEVAEKVKDDDGVPESTELVKSEEKSEGLIDKLVNLISSSDEKQETVVTAELTSEADEASVSPVDEVEKVIDKALEDAKPCEPEVSVPPDDSKESQAEGGLFAKLGSLFTTDEESKLPAIEVEKENALESSLSKAAEEVAVEDIPVSKEISKTASEEPVLEIKDKSLFTKLAELVSVSDKLPEEPTGGEASDVVSQETVSEPSQKTLPEKVPEAEDLQPSMISPEMEAKPSLFDRVASIFSKDSEPVPTGESQTDEQEISSDSSKDQDSKTEKDDDDQLFVVVSRPSSPVDTGDPEDGGQQTLQSSGWLPGSWFRSTNSVKQEGKDVIIQVGTDTPEKDFGQSNPEDSDMYTTRS